MRTLVNLLLTVGTVFGFLAGCTGLQPSTGADGATGVTPSYAHYKFFSYTGGKQTFKVPAGVTSLTITAYGANGADGLLYPSGYSAGGGAGGMVTATIPVTPKEVLGIFVGGSGQHGGFNGGGGVGDTNCSGHCASYGAGASDVRQNGVRLANRVVVAGGGGGGGGDGYACYSSSCGGGTLDAGSGGDGGGLTGEPGGGGSGLLFGGGGAGGSQNAGGEGGAGGGSNSACDGGSGTLGAGGAGHSARGTSHGCGGNGGGAGGGYNGGGGGGAGGTKEGSRTSRTDYGPGGGGGGGSSFVEKRAKHVQMTHGGNPTPDGNGSILVFW